MTHIAHSAPCGAPQGPSTYSIVAADPAVGQVGVALQSKFLAAGATVPWARGGVGAVATQARANVRFGPLGLDLLEAGHAPQDVVDRLVGADPEGPRRQVAVVGLDGEAAAFTGSACFPEATHVVGDGFATQGNILSSAAVPSAMGQAFTVAEGPLAVRLFAALRAGEEAGGERRGMESAGIVVAKPGAGMGGHDRLVDLRVDHADNPLDELAGLLELHHLYFGTSAPDDWLPLDAALQREVAGLLRQVPWVDTEHLAFPSALYNALGWLNLERRWVGPDYLDPVALSYLRDHVGGGAQETTAGVRPTVDPPSRRFR